jgi:hypothetical protein
MRYAKPTSLQAAKNLLPISRAASGLSSKWATLWGQWLLARRRDDSEGGSRDVQSMKGIIFKFGTGTGIEYVNNWMRLVSSYYGEMVPP